MKEDNVKGVLIDVINQKYEVKTIADELPSYYEELNCDCISIYRRKIGNIWYSVICDDEGALKDNPTVSGVDYAGRVAFVGNIFIVNGNIDDGEMHSLTDAEIDNLLANVSTKVLNHKGEAEDRVILFNIEY